MRKIGRLVICCFLCLAFVVPGVAQKKRRKAMAWGVPAVYSNLYLLPESGDVGGMEVILIPVYGGTWATVVMASGIAYDPVMIPVKENFPLLEFTLPETRNYAGYGKFTGRITAAGLTLTNKMLGKIVLKQQCR
ncbi:MAG: hypothetical protein HY231_17025 [Acidobacteria bacterium]|nr:hypothetical protein [Acidobacteriota bacterium]